MAREYVESIGSDINLNGNVMCDECMRFFKSSVFFFFRDAWIFQMRAQYDATIGIWNRLESIDNQKSIGL